MEVNASNGPGVPAATRWPSVSSVRAAVVPTATTRLPVDVVAVGTTAARTLETLGQRVAAGTPGPFDAFTSIYITPGYEWRMVDALVTNFHLPKSTLMLMISAFAGREHVLAAYRQAIEARYRFFSFGDAMFIR